MSELTEALELYNKQLEVQRKVRLAKEELNKTIVEAYHAGIKIQTIANLSGVSRSTIYRLVS